MNILLNYYNNTKTFLIVFFFTTSLQLSVLNFHPDPRVIMLVSHRYNHPSLLFRMRQFKWKCLFLTEPYRMNKSLAMGHTKSKKLIILGIVQLLVAVGALPAGYLLMANPDGSGLGMTPDILAGSPFRDFFIPGLFLFTVNGLFNLGNAIACFVKFRYAPESGLILGGVLMTWVAVQVSIIGLSHFLQPTYFVIGIMEVALAGWLISERKKYDPNRV